MEMQFIRGVRIEQQILDLLGEDSTYAELKRGTISAFPATTKRQNATGPIQVAKLTIQPFGPTSDLQATGVVSNEGRQYESKIMFLQVEYEDEDSPQNITFKAMDGDEYHIQPILLTESNCKVSCSCMDFYWRFAMFNFSDDSLIGNKPPPYQRRTENRPPANPAKIPGVCKHIIKLVDKLKTNGMVR